MQTIAVIGLGIMGSGIADNYLKRGYQVYVWNRTKEKADGLIKKGAIYCDSPQEAASKADIVFEVTANDESSRRVWLDEDGILSLKIDNKQFTLVTCATLSAGWVDELATRCQEAKIRNDFFDMPMTGGRVGAESGELILLVGGDEQKLSELKPKLEPIAKDVKYFGKAGSGTRYKLILNMLQAVHIAGLGEALRLAKTAGLDEKLTGDALAERPGGVTTNLAWRDYQKEPEPINFSVEWIAKDLRYAKQMTDEVQHPLLDRLLEQYEAAIAEGFSQSDWTKINKL